MLTNTGKYNVIKGPTVLYTTYPIDGLRTYVPLALDESKALINIRNAILIMRDGKPSELLLNYYLRFGWIEPGFNSLEWINISDILKKYYYKTITPREKRKLMELCKILFISIKEISKIPGNTTKPTKRLKG